MKPICPHCGSPMPSAKAKAKTKANICTRESARASFRTYCCEPCGYVYSEVLAAYDVAERAMMLDLEAGAPLGAMH